MTYFFLINFQQLSTIISENMKNRSNFILLGIVVSFIIFSGCKKHDHGLPITIEQISTASNDENGYTETGTFTTSGGIQTSGTFVMNVTFVADSFYCTNKLIAPEGTFTTNMRCSATTNTGAWKILSSTGHYKLLNGGGTLVMTYPPGVLGVETLTGTVWLHP
jgi:hypothetical protein